MESINKEPLWIRYLRRTMGDEYADLCLLPQDQLQEYIAERMENFDTEKDEIMNAGFPTELFSSMREVEQFIKSAQRK